MRACLTHQGTRHVATARAVTTKAATLLELETLLGTRQESAHLRCPYYACFRPLQVRACRCWLAGVLRRGGADAAGCPAPPRGRRGEPLRLACRTVVPSAPALRRTRHPQQLGRAEATQAAGRRQRAELLADPGPDAGEEAVWQRLRRRVAGHNYYAKRRALGRYTWHTCGAHTPDMHGPVKLRCPVEAPQTHEMPRRTCWLAWSRCSCRRGWAH